ncbi:hypothetical protein, partial [Roseibacillus persicicus]|uniref:hypothetical protein n=1 Tax=Roseibacillus persicicus TaxID=454148 RepID=UPI00280F2533
FGADGPSQGQECPCSIGRAVSPKQARMFGEGLSALAHCSFTDPSTTSDHSRSFYQKDPTDAHQWWGQVFGSLETLTP